MFLHTVAHCDMPDEFVGTCVQLLLQLFRESPRLILGAVELIQINLISFARLARQRMAAIELACQHEF